MSRSRSFNRRFTPGHPGFDALKQPGQRYRIEKRIADIWVPVSSTPTVDVALAFLRSKGWRARIIRISDGAIVHEEMP